MNNEQEIKSLTWKYFWQQKAIEVGEFLLSLLVIIPVPYFIGKLLDPILCEDNIECISTNLFMIWFKGIFLVILTGFILFCMGCLLYSLHDLFKYWIKSNWERASERAREDLK